MHGLIQRPVRLALALLVASTSAAACGGADERSQATWETHTAAEDDSGGETPSDGEPTPIDEEPMPVEE